MGTTRRTTAAWPAERVELLRQRVAAGHSASEIGAEFGLSRSAVISKCSRLGLQLQGSPVGRKSEKAVARPAVAQPAARIAAFDEARPARAAAVSAAPDARSLTPLIPDLLSLPFRGACKWTYGERDFAYCGRRTEAGRVYCADHAGLAYVAPSTQRRPPRAAAPPRNSDGFFCDEA